MHYSYYFTIDEFIAEPQPPLSFDLSHFTRLLADTLWNMGEAIWRVDEDD